MAAKKSAAQVQIDMLREASDARRFAMARSVSALVIDLSRRAIREASPDLDQRAYELRCVELHYGPDLARRVAAYLAQRG